MKHLFSKLHCSMCTTARIFRHHRRFLQQGHIRTYKQNEPNKTKKENLYLSSKEIRKLYLNYFQDQNHTYVHSSPIFLNNDPSLLFVNAGMNQFRSLFLNTILPNHEFYNLKRAANSQKCVRISGKHNDLEDVGHDFHHHTFFEMLGNWSFGDYFKKEACQMAWELLTKVYGLPENRLYITYFGGDPIHNLPADEECKNIWLDIGVPEDHILPFGVKENFWDMGDKGPCGPCTEIHYDFLGNQQAINNTPSPLQRVNAGRSDLIEVWNLVFIQYKRGSHRNLETLPIHNVDTGMGLERLTAILQGTMSNYDTDIFKPLFQAIEKNFKVKPYEGKVGSEDITGMDTAYRIIGDHARMFTVSIADGLFPDNYYAGHVLRKIIRRTAYFANCVMKTRPGVLSSLIPYVAESLDFFPEVEKHAKEAVRLVNEEEKMFHQLINRGRKMRNKMISERSSNILEGKNVWELHNVYGLEERIIQDLASEINLSIDWDGYHKINQDQVNCKPTAFSSNSEEKIIPPEVLENLQDLHVPHTVDSYKYSCYFNQNENCVEDITANILAIIQDKSIVNSAAINSNCLLIADRTNFYSNAGGQIADIGQITGKGFMFQVENVHSLDGYVFHEGKVVEGNIHSNSEVWMSVEKVHRQGCTNNHTAAHLVNAALRKMLPYTAQRSSYVGPLSFRLGFSSKAPLTQDQIADVERFVNSAIEQKLIVSRTEMPLEDILVMPNVRLLPGEEYPDLVTVISIGENSRDSEIISVESCCGTHVTNTADIGNFVIVASKAQGGTVKILSAVTGKQAEVVCQNGEVLEQYVSDLEQRLESMEKLQSAELPSLLKEVKKISHECRNKTDVPLRTLKICEMKLKDMKLKLNDLTGNFSQVDQSKDEISSSKQNCKSREEILKAINTFGVPPTVDNSKYNYYYKEGKYHVEPILAKITAVFQSNALVKDVVHGQHCVIVTDKTNFYAEAGGQNGDQGIISGKDFVFHVTDVFHAENYIFHEGWVEKGTLRINSEAQLLVDEEHRRSCTLNHTAIHLLHSALRKTLPYTFQRSAYAGPSHLQFNFSSKSPLSVDQLHQIETLINTAIQQRLDVVRTEILSKQLKEIPEMILSPGEKFLDPIPVISIGVDKPDSILMSMEPCCGTHARKTSDIGQFVITSYKSDKSSEKIIRAVTGETAKVVLKLGKDFDEEMSDLENQVLECLESKNNDSRELWDYLKEVKRAKGLHETELPLLLFREHQDKLTELTLKLTDRTNEFVQEGFRKIKSEMHDVLKKHESENYVIHRIASVGDAKKIVNYALANVTDKPAMFFAVDGHKSIICSCSLPQSYVNSSLSALLWINPVAELLNGRARSLSTDPELNYSVLSNDVHKIDEAIEVARNYIQSNLL